MMTYEMDPDTRELAHEIYRSFDGQTTDQRTETPPKIGATAAHLYFAELNIPFGD